MKRRGAGTVRPRCESASDSLLLPEYHRVHHRTPDDNGIDDENSKTRATRPRRSLFTSRWIMLLLIAAGGTTIITLCHRTLLSHHYAYDRSVLGSSLPPFYMPSILLDLSNSSSSSSSISMDTLDDFKAEWNSPMIHIVHTRFMQEQGNLTALGHARMHLFRVFCLPTMVQQTSQDFIWIIKTDPYLDQSLLQQLLQDISPYPNIYLVASLQNYRINAQFPGSWRGGAEPRDLSQSPVYSGNRRRLELAMSLQAHLPVLETRLDADDGLHLKFIETLQKMALKWFGTHTHVKWTYWCARRHMEWHWVDLVLDNSNSNNSVRNQQQQNKSSFSLPTSSSDQAYGSLFGTRHENLCITPGITVGFPVGTEESQVPIYPHDKIVVNIRHEYLAPEDGCGLDDTTQCLQFIENFVFCAIRSRTPTSAGMLHVLQNNADPDTISNVDPHSWLNYAYWDKLRESFGLKREHMKQINQYLLDHVLEIAEENLLGQCTTGHSCKGKAKKALEELIEMRRNASFNVNGPRP